MAEKFEYRFNLNAPLELVWSFVIDPYQIIDCLPGAAITGKADERTYTGTVTVKVGAVAASYRGKATFERIDQVRHESEVVGLGQDTRGKGSAEMRMVSRLTALGPTQTQIVVNSEVQITGMLAQLGRGMIQNVADQMLQEFTGKLKQKLEQAGTKYAKIVQVHAESFAKIYSQKLAEVHALAGIKVNPDGSNTAASPSDVNNYLQAIKKIAGDVVYNSARIVLTNAARKENVPLHDL